MVLRLLSFILISFVDLFNHLFFKVAVIYYLECSLFLILFINLGYDFYVGFVIATLWLCYVKLRKVIL